MALDPQLQALQGSLNDAISQGQLCLDASSMGPGSLPIIALFQQVFGRADITIGGNLQITPDEANDRLLVSGTGVTSLFNVTAMDVALVFGSATASTLDVTGTLTPPAMPAWTFATSFPDLANTFFDQLAFTAPFFTISTYSFRRTAPAITVVTGAGLCIQPTALTGPLEPVTNLATPPSSLPPFYGPVSQTQDTRSIALALAYSPVRLDLVDFPSLAFSQPALVLRSDRIIAAQLNRNAIALEDSVAFGFVTVPLAIVLPEAETWMLDMLPGSPQPIPSITSFIALFSGIDLAGAVPADVLPLPGFWFTSLQARFDLATGVINAWNFVVTTHPPGGSPSTTRWTVIPKVLELSELTLNLQVTLVRPGGKGPTRTRLTGSIVGLFNLGSTVDVRIVIPIPVSQEWIFQTTSAIVLPSLRDLAKLVAGVDPGTLLPPGAGMIGDFTLSSVVLTLDPVKPALVVFSFTLVSTNDWVIVPPDRLRIKDLQLSFQIDEPFGLRTTTGLIRGTLHVGSWDIDVLIERQPYELDWNMQVSSAALPLPSISDLDQLAGTGLTPYLPQTLATASFTLSDLLIDVNLSQASMRQLAFQLESDQPWTILQDVLVIERAGLYVDLSWFTGEMLASFGVWGALRIVGTGIEVSADRVGAGEWTFRGALAAGETISIGGLVAQLLRIDPAYLPSLEVEGLAASFSTPSNDYSFQGRTAGLWTFEVSSALTLRMRAEAAFQRTAGATSGYLAGDFYINSLNVFVSYAFDPTSTTLLFRLTYGRFNPSAALTSGTNAKGQPFSLLTFRLGHMSFGEILEGLVQLASPGSTFRLQPPWDVLNQISLKNLSLVVDLKSRDVTVNYDIALNLVFINITGIGLKYDTSSGEGSVKIQLSGRFLDQEYNLASGNPLEWDVLHEPAPSVPAKGPELFDLKYLGLGQRVSFSNLAALNTVGEVIAAMREQMTPVQDAARNPLATGNGSTMRFDRGSGILAGAEFEILSTLSAALIFNDPYLYGMRLALAGQRAGSLAGLSFELLYKKITNDIGVFKIELRVPDAFRQFEFGAASVTLPLIKVDVYTNGNFRVDLGFPRAGDFKDSFCLQVFPFIGFGGFYFAALTGATSERVPRIVNGSFDPVIEAGLGLQVGLGKEIRKGPLSGGIYVTVVGILEGAVAWFTPTDVAARDGTYYWIEGSIGVVGKVYGAVDFAVIKVSVRLEARLTVWLVLEAYEPTYVRVAVTVEAEASVKVFFVRVHFSFSVGLDEQFVVGSQSTPPWLVAPGAPPLGEQPRLRMQQTRWRARSRLRELRLRARTARPLGATWTPWDPLLVFATKQDLALTLLPALTVATPSGSQTPALQIAFVLLAENGVAPAAATREQLRSATAAHSSRTTDPMSLPFNLLVEAMLQWAVYSVTGSPTGTVTAGDLEEAYALLEDEATFNDGFAYGNLSAFLENNFKIHISGLPANLDSATDTSGTPMAMLPQLSFSHDSTQLHFDSYNLVSPQYEADIRRYYEQLLVDYEYGRALEPTGAAPGARTPRSRLAETAEGEESMATVIFREYMMILAKSAVQAARDCLTRFKYPVTPDDSLDTIAAQFPAVPLPDLDATLAVTPQMIAWANRQAPVTADKPWTLNGLAYQINAGDSLSALAGKFKLATAADLIGAGDNSSNRQLLAAGAQIFIAQPASTDYTWFTYISVAGDALLSIAVWAFVRAAAGSSQNQAWYAQTIVNFNTDPQRPYAGPDLTGVIATGTTLRIPAALNDSDAAHALTYVTRAGDTLWFVAAYYDVLQNAPQLLQTLSAGLQTLNPGIDWAQLPAGTQIHVPALTYMVAAGESLASIATRFLLAPADLAYGANATATSLLAPLAVLALPTITYTTGSADSIGSVAGQFNTTVEALAGDIAQVPGLFAYPQSLAVPDVPAYPVAALVRQIILGQYANEAAMAVSRFVASGLRLPTSQGASTLEALYVLTGQQQACPTPPSTYTFTSSVSWIDFTDSTIATGSDTLDALRSRDPQIEARNPVLRELPLRAGMHLLLGGSRADLPVEITQALLDSYAPSSLFDPLILSGPSPLDIVRRTRVTYRLDRSVHWQTPLAVPFAGGSAAPVTGEPSIWLFPESLEQRAGALGWGTTPFALHTQAGDTPADATTDPVIRYDWATLVNLLVRQAPSTQGSGWLPNTYEIAGMDADSKARLLALLNYLTQTGQQDRAQLFILYSPNADTNNPDGLASASVSATTTFILRTNLSTLTASGPHGAVLAAAPKDNLYAATVAQATDFIQLLWEAGVTASGGYLLNYADASGRGLPAEVFASSALGELRLLILLASQSAASDPDRTLYAFNNCALVGDNIDASAQKVIATVADEAKVQWRQSASIPPGNVGFELTRANPGTVNDPEHRTQNLYSLLAFHSIGANGFALSNEGLPVSPVRPEDTPSSVVDAPWHYSQVLGLGKLTTSTLPSAPFLPAPAADPYAGIAAGAKLALAMDFHDVYGNETVSQSPIPNLDVPVGYIDDVIGMAQWPGLATSYRVAGHTAAPQIVIDAALQVSNYAPGGGASFEAVQRNTNAHRARLAAIYYQIWQEDVSISLTTSLVQPAGQPAQAFTVDRLPFANFISASYIFLGTAQLFERASQLAGTGTLASIAQALTADSSYLDDSIAALAQANQDEPTAMLFAAPLAVPVLALTAFGDTLDSIVDRAGQPAITAVQLAQNNSAAPLNAGVDIAAPARNSTPVTAQTRLIDIAEAMHGLPGAIGEANAAVGGLLAENAPITVDGVTVLVEIDPISQKTWSLADLGPKFAERGVTATPAIIAVANQRLRGMFAAGQTLIVSDYVLQPQDTFANLAQRYTQFSIAALAQAAAGSPNIFPAGLPLFIRPGEQVAPSATQTLQILAEAKKLTVGQIALANRQTALVPAAALWLPDRVTIDANSTAALSAYTVASGGATIAGIVSTFAEASALALATRNWTLTHIFVPEQTVSVGSATTTTQDSDSLASVYARLHAQDPSVTQAQFVEAIAPSSTLIRTGALLAVVLPSTGSTPTSLQILAERFGTTAAAIAQANASLVGFIASQVTIRLGSLSLTTGPNETLTNLVRRFQQELGVQTTVAAIAQDNATIACVAAQQRFVLPPSQVSVGVTLPEPPAADPPYPGNPFALSANLTITRQASCVDPQFASVAAVASATTRLAPQASQSADQQALSLEDFAQALEQVYPALKVAVGGQDDGARDVWIVNFGPGGVTSVAVDGAKPSFFALAPLSTSLQDLTGVPIRTFDPSTGQLTPENDPPLFDMQSIDFDVWAGVCFNAVDQMLTPAYASPGYLLNTTAFSQLVGAKQKLAERICTGVLPILDGTGGNAAEAAERIRQQLLVSLAAGYATAAVVQYPVQVTSGFTSAGAPRMLCELMSEVFRTGERDDLGTLSAYYDVPAAAIAMLLGEAVRILASGTEITFKGAPYTIEEGDTIDRLMVRVGASGYQDFITNLATPNGFFQPHTVLNIDGIDGTAGEASADAMLLTLVDLVSYFHTPLPLLAATLAERKGIFVDGVTVSVAGHGSIVISDANNSLVLAALALQFESAAALAEAIQVQTGILNPRCAVHVVRFVPEHTLSAARLSLGNGATTMNALFDVRSQARAKNMFLRPSLHVTQLEYDIVPVAGGFESSRWLSFVLPIAQVGRPLQTDLGEVQIPIPLRAYPTVPSMLGQSGAAAGQAPQDITSAKAWRFSFDYQHHLAAQDTLYVDATFNVPLQGGTLGRDISPALGSALAQFISAWPAVNEALTALLTWDGSPNVVLAQTLQTFADMANAVADGWAPAARLGTGNQGQTYSYRVDTTVRAGEDGLIDYLDTLRVSVLSHEGISPTGEFPQIQWRRPGGAWRALDLRSHSATQAIYSYLEDVPADQTIQHQITFDALDAVAWQNGTGSARLTRNEHLVGAAATARAFIYNTNTVGFAQPTVPLIQHDTVILFNDDLPLQQALTNLFTTLLGASAAEYWLKVSVEFGYELVATQPPAPPIASFLPIGLLPTSQYDAGLPDRIFQLIDTWRTGKPFAPTQGLFSLDVTVFTTLTPSESAKVPLLRLKHLVYDNSSPHGSFAHRLWQRRPG